MSRSDSITSRKHPDRLQRHTGIGSIVGPAARARRLSMVVVLGLALTAAAAWFERDRAIALARTELETDGEMLASALEKGLYAPIEVLAYIPAFFQSSDYVSAEEFARFASPALARHTGVAAVGWAPRVGHSERQEFTSEIRRRYWADFELRRIGPDGEIEPSPKRNVYFPLIYRVPEIPAVRGVDVRQHPELRDAIEQMLILGTPTISARFPLPSAAGSQQAVAVLAPVYDHDAPAENLEQRRGAMEGVALAVLRIDDVVDRALRGLDLRGLRPVITDLTAVVEPAELYPRRRLLPGDEPDRQLWWRDLQVQDRIWRVSLFGSAARLDGIYAASRAGVVGIVSTGAIALGLFAIGAVIRLRREVSEAQQLGQYTLVRRIGEGGMGKVYAAKHAMLRRPTAVKVISGDKLTDELIERFEREVRYTSELTHPNTIAIYDFGHTPSGVFYYAMEYLEGIPLDTLVKECGPQQAGRVVNILRQASGSLAEAHSKGLVHRDIKPANIMICDRGGIPDLVKVLDFGLVKQIASGVDPELSNVDKLLGTPLFMSPEAIARPDELSPASDVYALCAVGYYLLVGAPVFEGRSVVEVCSKHLSEDPVPPNERMPGCSTPELDRLILDGLAKDPAERPADGAELLRRLEALSDVAPWPFEEAAEWWRSEGHGCIDAAKRLQDPVSSAGASHTLNVDLGTRADPGDARADGARDR